MGSRIRTNTDGSHVFECYLEIGLTGGGSGSNGGPSMASSAERAVILSKYPDTYNSQEILKSVPQFAYPCDVTVETVTHFSFVMTNTDAKWTFGFCRLAPYSHTCLAIVSHLPWHSTFYKILNHLADIVSHQEWPLDKQHAFKCNFLDAIYQSDIPQPGYDLVLSYYMDNGIKEFSAQCPDHHKLPSIPEDRNLTEYFNAIDSSNMIVIFANMLNERRIIMTSKKLSRLSACVQAANALIYPMHWQHIFIPVLPNHLLDYLSAPMPFLIGVPSVLMSRVRRSELGDIVILDCDQNRIESPFDDVQMLPTDIVHTLRKSLRNPMSVSMLGDLVARSFLRALVSLIGCYRDALRFTPGQKISFNYEAFVSSRSPSVQTFLEKMLQLQIFRQFIEGRLEMLNNGEGFSDEFEFELNMYEDKSTHRLKTQYREWLGAMRKEGGAILKSVNPRVKSVYQVVKHKSRQTYRDLKIKMQTNNNNDKTFGYSHNTQHNKSGDYKAHKTSSAPSSPTLPVRSMASNIKKSISGNVIGKTDKTVTYVRQRQSKTEFNGDEPNGKAITHLQNGFTKSLSVSGISTSMASPSAPVIAPEASPEISDVDSEQSHDMLTFDRIEIDLMGELKHFLNKKSSTDESSSSSRSNKSNASSSSQTLSINTAIARPIPPPRSQVQRKTKPFMDDSNGGGVGGGKGGQQSLIELDTPPDEDIKADANVIFDPLFETNPSQPPLKPQTTSVDFQSLRNSWNSLSNNFNNNNNNNIVNNNNTNDLRLNISSFVPNLNPNSLMNANPVNPFLQLDNQSHNNRPKNSFEFVGQLPAVVAQTSGGGVANSASALSMHTNPKQTTYTLSDMINWSSTQITSGAQKPNLMPTLPPVVQTTPLSTATTSTGSGNPFKTSNSWQHFD